MTNEEVAKKLAQITGKPITEFFNGTVNQEHVQMGDVIAISSSTPSPEPKTSILRDTEIDENETRPNRKDRIKRKDVFCDVQIEFDKCRPNNQGQDNVDDAQYVAPVISGQLLEYQKLFPGSKVVNGFLLEGRQMTAKEYQKYVRNMTSDEFLEHPLMHKIFRAEGQINPNFMEFSERFKKNDKKQE